MRNTKQLSTALTKIQADAMIKIKSFFKGQPYVRIHIMPSQHLTIRTGMSIGTVTEICSNGDIYYTSMLNGYTKPSKIVNREVDGEPLPADALLTILDELERMKKTHQLKKP